MSNRTAEEVRVAKEIMDARITAATDTMKWFNSGKMRC